jgi:hypothetical protein
MRDCAAAVWVDSYPAVLTVIRLGFAPAFRVGVSKALPYAFLQLSLSKTPSFT